MKKVIRHPIKCFRARWTPAEQLVLTMYAASLVMLIAGGATSWMFMITSGFVVFLASIVVTYVLEHKRRMAFYREIILRNEADYMVRQIELYLIRKNLGLPTQYDRPEKDGQ